MSKTSCNKRIWNKGYAIGSIINEPSKDAAEAFIQRIATETGEEVDWHYMGGRVEVIAILGDYVKIVDAIVKSLPHGWNFRAYDLPETFTMNGNVTIEGTVTGPSTKLEDVQSNSPDRDSSQKEQQEELK